MVISIRGILYKTRDKVMEKCFGLTVAFTKDNGEEAFKTEKDRYT